MRLLIADGSMCSCSAARAIVRQSQTATNRRSVFRSMSRTAVWMIAGDVPFRKLGVSKIPLMQDCGMSKVASMADTSIGATTGDTSACRAFPTASSSAKSACATACRASSTILPTERKKREWIGAALRRRPARDRSRLVRAGATSAATRRHRRARRLREDAAGPLRLGAGAESEGRRARHRHAGRSDARAAVREPRAQPRQPAQDARRSRRRSRRASVPRAMRPARRR